MTTPGTNTLLHAAPGVLYVGVRRAGDHAVVVLTGELDVATVAQLASAVDDLIVAGRHHVVLDLEAVTFFDGAAVEAVIAATLAVALSGGTLTVTHNPRLMRLLAFTKETVRVNVAETVHTADVPPPAPADRVVERDADLAGWLRRSAGGDVLSLLVVYDVTAARAYGVALQVVGDAGLAAEVVEEAYLLVWRDAASFRPAEGSAVAWVMAVVHRCAVRRARSGERRVPLLDRAHEGPERRADDALDDLSSTQRRAVGLAFFRGCTRAGIEQEVGLPPGTAHLLIRDGLLRVRDGLRALSPSMSHTRRSGTEQLPPGSRGPHATQSGATDEGSG